MPASEKAKLLVDGLFRQAKRIGRGSGSHHKLQEAESALLDYIAALEDRNRWTEELEAEFPHDAEDCPYPIFVARMLQRGASYDGEAGVWWTEDDKPGIVRKLEKRIATIEARPEGLRDALEESESNEYREIVERAQYLRDKRVWVKNGTALHCDPVDGDDCEDPDAVIGELANIVLSLVIRLRALLTDTGGGDE